VTAAVAVLVFDWLRQRTLRKRGKVTEVAATPY
jgi:hypothetical protein